MSEIKLNTLTPLTAPTGTEISNIGSVTYTINSDAVKIPMSTLRKADGSDAMADLCSGLTNDELRNSAIDVNIATNETILNMTKHLIINNILLSELIGKNDNSLSELFNDPTILNYWGFYVIKYTSRKAVKF